MTFCLRVVAQRNDNWAASALADTSNAACVERLELPTYPLLARQARLAGTLSVTVRLDHNAVVDNVTAKADLNNNGAQGALFVPVKNAIFHKAQFRQDCADKEVILVFDFRITGDPSDAQQQEAAFGFPNRFLDHGEADSLSADATVASTRLFPIMSFNRPMCASFPGVVRRVLQEAYTYIFANEYGPCKRFLAV